MHGISKINKMADLVCIWRNTDKWTVGETQSRGVSSGVCGGREGVRPHPNFLENSSVKRRLCRGKSDLLVN